MNAKGSVFKYPDNVDTDVIIPARHLNTQDPKELASHCMEDIDKDFVRNVRDGDVMVGGWNFGCGSSREHAPVAIKAAGISVVIAKSFARIFYRNSINIGLPIMECPEAVDSISAGIPSAWILLPASSPMRPPARPSRRNPSRRLSRRSLPTVA